MIPHNGFFKNGEKMIPGWLFPLGRFGRSQNMKTKPEQYQNRLFGVYTKSVIKNKMNGKYA